MASKSIYEVELFKELGFVRRQCPSCKRYFWTLNPDMERCGDQPCVEYSFLGNPPTPRSYTMAEVRETYLSFFERRGHTRIRRYPVVARWRDDVFLVGASIYDFQPWVTGGIAPPPANPLTISQPSIRLTDVDNVGRTGRHLTEFEMLAHHAFNYPDKYVYWSDDTTRLCFELFTQEFKIPPEKLTFIEDWWAGGGNAGEDFEVLVEGLEVATLVFMQYRTLNDHVEPMDLKVVDTGYGLQRILWLTTGAPTIYDASFGPVVDKLVEWSGVGKVEERIFREASRLAGLMDFKGVARFEELRQRVASRIGIPADELDRIMRPREAIYAISDHTNALTFMLGDGIVPSNVAAGYLARLLLRRTLRHMREIGLEVPVAEIIRLQIDLLAPHFPEFKEREQTILEMVDVEEKRYRETLTKGSALVKRRVSELKAKKVSELPLEQLIEFYDSHGLPPDFVKEVAEAEGVKVEIPVDFYAMIAKRHERPEEAAVQDWFREMEKKVEGLPQTKLLYYEDPSLLEFSATVEAVIDGGYVVLNQTAFYPEGGGQLADTGYISFDGKEAKVVDVQKVGDVVVHKIEGPAPSKGQSVVGRVDRERRERLRRHHTATHIIIGAARRVLGEHAWQWGAQKDVDRARLDITHFQRVSPEEVAEIERLANQVVLQNIPVEISWMSRNDAEAKYGFRLYQGGAVPGAEIRVVKIGDWDVEACGGLHCSTTGEVGLIKIVRTDRIQDGVERFVFVAGEAALDYIREKEESLNTVASTLKVPIDRVEEAVKQLVDELRKTRKELEKFKAEVAEAKAVELLSTAEVAGNLKVVSATMPGASTDDLIQIGLAMAKREPSVVAILGTTNGAANVVIVAGDDAVKQGVNAGELAKLAAAELQGGGGGKANLGQGGGLRKENLDKALAKAVEALKK